MHLSDDSINSSGAVHTNEYSLSIRIDSDGFSLSVHDEEGDVVLFQYVEETLSQLSIEEVIKVFEKQRGIVFSDYSDVNLLVVGDAYLLVPEVLFNPQHIDDYFKFQFEREKDELVLFNRVNAWDSVAVFSVSAVLSKALSVVFPEIPLTHHISSFLTTIGNKKEDGLYVLIREKKIDVVALKGAVPVLINNFCYQSDEDLIYFLLCVFEQVGFDINNHPLFLFQKEKDLHLKKRMQNYIKNCSLSVIS